jgi:hypothetical protein
MSLQQSLYCCVKYSHLTGNLTKTDLNSQVNEPCLDISAKLDIKNFVL